MTTTTQPSTPEINTAPIADREIQGSKPVWPSEELASSIYGLANIGLIIGLVIGIVSTILVVWMGDVKEQYLRTSLANTNERAAHAEERAAKAELDLAKLKTPRTLNSEQQTRISAALKPFTGQIFDIALNIDDESKNLLPQIEDTMKAAGWSQIDWKGASGTADINFVRAGRPIAGIASVSGVIIQMHSEQVEKMKGAASILASALDAEGISARAELGLGIPNTNATAIHILVGSKPK